MARIARNQRNSQNEQWLVFIDTNIILDFYRQGNESAIRHLAALERHKNSLILSNQVWMEFLKNRQKVIVASITETKRPDQHPIPNLVADYQQSKMVRKHLKAATASHDRVRSRIETILRNPSSQDHVYRTLKRIFDSSNQKFKMNRESKDRFKIRNLAKKRFVLGYPPRKSSDTSIGDSINWEWIVHCAKKNCEDNHHILIVSRDGDYGVPYGKEAILNDWLRREFKERVSKRRKLELTTRLTTALKKLDEQVTAEDEKEETILIENIHANQITMIANEEGSSSTIERIIRGLV